MPNFQMRSRLNLLKVDDLSTSSSKRNSLSLSLFCISHRIGHVFGQTILFEPKEECLLTQFQSFCKAYYVVFHFVDRFRFYLQNVHQIERWTYSYFVHFVRFISGCLRVTPFSVNACAYSRPVAHTHLTSPIIIQSKQQIKSISPQASTDWLTCSTSMCVWSESLHIFPIAMVRKMCVCNGVDGWSRWFRRKRCN